MAGNSAFKAYLSLIPKLDDGAEREIKQELSSVDTEPAGRAMGGKLGKGLSAAAVAAAAAAAAAVVAVVKQALDQYAEYEQLVGGVETLFKDSADTVQQYASQAYKTAGMSANEYMNTVTGFSASLLQSLGGDTEKAARYADMAITDMADNANKMGTSMESIQNAYQGFAKQNYTMLDNLKLGYGGTKTEMERLLKDAEAISGVHYDISQYADIVEAIHVVQTEIGITGTTAQEAATTIQGSIGMAKAAYMNWLTALADENADLGAITGELVTAVIGAAKNVIARIPDILVGLMDSIPDFVAAGIQLFTSLVESMTEALPTIIENLPTMVEGIANAIMENLPLLINAGIELFLALIPAMLRALPELVKSAAYLGVSIVTGIMDGISEKASHLFDGLVNAINNGIKWIKNLLGIASPSKVFAEIGANTILGFEDGIKAATPDAIKAMEDAAANISAVGAVDLAINGGAGGARGAGNVVYINGATVNDTPGIQNALVDFLLDLQRLGVMEGATA